MGDPEDAIAPVMLTLAEGDHVNVDAPIVPVILFVSAMDGAVPEQIVAVAGVAVAEGVGFTVMVNVLAVPEQAVADAKEGVTVMVDDIGVVPVLVAVNEEIFPVPLVVAKPIAVLLLVQLKFVPETAPLNTIAAVAALLQ